MEIRVGTNHRRSITRLRTMGGHDCRCVENLPIQRLFKYGNSGRGGSAANLQRSYFRLEETREETERAHNFTNGVPLFE